jgi:hypothetical protein
MESTCGDDMGAGHTIAMLAVEEELCMARNETSKASARKKSGGAKGVLQSVVGSGAATETLIDLAQKLGLADLVIGRVRAKIDDTDVDELFDDVTDYLRRNPEVLVVTLGAVTAATGLLVWLNGRREWDGEERRELSTPRTGSGPRPVGASPRPSRRPGRSEQ